MNNFRADYHLHTCFSFDSEADPGLICEKAIALGLSEIAITDHLDIYADKDYNYILDVAGIYEKIDELREKYPTLKILKGAELGQPQRNPAAHEKFFKDFNPDFVIGSIHNMENDVDIYDYNWAEMDEISFYHSYLDWEIDLAKNYDFDVLGHVTYPFRCVYEAKKTGFDFAPFKEHMEELFKIVISRGKGIECNISGLLQPIGETLPGLEVLKFYHELGGEIITVGTDAHVPERVGLNLNKGYALIKEAGFEYVTSYENRVAKMKKI